MELTQRQSYILDIVKQFGPISGDQIASKVGLSKSTLRSDLSFLTGIGLLQARPKIGYIYSQAPVQRLQFANLYQVKVSQIMSQAVFVQPTASIQEAVTALFLNDVGSLFISQENQLLLGIVSRKDLLRFTLGDSDIQRPVAMLMTRMPNIITATEDQTLLEVGQLMVTHQIDTIPILKKHTREMVIGKISKTTLVNYFINQATTLSTISEVSNE